MNVNQVNLAGRLTRSPELKYLPSQLAVCDFGIAVNRKWRTEGGEEKEDVCFVDVSAFGKQAELINEKFEKGKEIWLSGRLKFDSWEDKQSHAKRSKLSVVLEQFQFVGPAIGSVTGSAAGGSASGGGAAPRAPGQRPATPPQSPPFGEERQFTEADIPFAWPGRSDQPL